MQPLGGRALGSRADLALPGGRLGKEAEHREGPGGPVASSFSERPRVSSPRQAVLGVVLVLRPSVPGQGHVPPRKTVCLWSHCVPAADRPARPGVHEGQGDPGHVHTLLLLNRKPPTAVGESAATCSAAPQCEPGARF